MHHVAGSLSCNDVIVAEVIQVEVLVKDLKHFGWLVGTVGVDSRVD